MGLILTRRLDEKIIINDSITLHVTRLNSTQVAFGIEAPRDVAVDRAEVRLKKGNKSTDVQGASHGIKS